MGPFAPNGTTDCLNVSDPHTGKAVVGCWPVTGNVWDHPASERNTKQTTNTVFKISNIADYLILPNQNGRTSLGIFFPRAVSKIEYPDICSCFLELPVHPAIPFFCPVTRFKDQLAIPVENLESQACCTICIERIKPVVFPVSIRCKCIRYGNITGLQFGYLFAGCNLASSFILDDQSDQVIFYLPGIGE